MVGSGSLWLILFAPQLVAADIIAQLAVFVKMSLEKIKLDKKTRHTES